MPSVSVLQLAMLARHTTPLALQRGAAFIRTELPTRLVSRALAVESALRSPPVAAFAEEWKRIGIEVGVAPEEIQSFAGIIDDCRRRIETSTQTLLDGVRDQHRAVADATTSRLLEEVSFTQLGCRMMLGQYCFLVRKSRGDIPDTVLAPVPATPVDLQMIVRDSISDTRAFCMEKYGDAPRVVVKGNPATALCSPAQLHFVFVELLKNAMRASMERDLADPPAITVSLTTRGGTAEVRVQDDGGGINGGSGAGRYFGTLAPEREPTYTYSGSFGAAFAGKGVGLPLSRLIAVLHGGELCVRNHGGGVEAVITLDRHGRGHDHGGILPPHLPVIVESKDQQKR